MAEKIPYDIIVNLKLRTEGNKQVTLNMDQLRLKQVALQAEIAKTEKAMRKLVTSREGGNVPAQKAIEASDRYKKLRADLVDVTAQMKKYNTEVARAARAQIDATMSAVSMGEKTKTTKMSLSSMGLSIGALIAAYYTLDRTIGKVIRTFSQFEYTLMNVQTLLDEEFKTLEQDSISIMKKYGMGIKDVNKAFFDTISAMIPAAEATKFMNEAARLAVGGVTDLKTAVDGLTSIVNAYSLEVAEAGRVADAFFRAQKFGKTTVSDLAQHMGRVAPIAAIAKVSYQEMLSTLAELTLGGLTTEESVTILRQAIAALIKPAEGAKKALNEFNVPVGIAAVSAAGLTYSLGQLTKAAIKYPDIIADMIPNIRAFTGVAALTGERLEHLKYIMQDVNQNFGEFSSLNQAYEKQMSTLAKQYDIWNAKIRAVFINIGGRLKPVLIWLMDNTPILTRMIIALTAAITVFNIGTGRLALNLGVLRNAFNKLTAALINNPYAALAAAVAAIGIAIHGFVKEAKRATFETAAFHEELGGMKREINSLFVQLGGLERGSSEYAAALAYINEKYGDYLKNMLTDKSTTEELAEAKRLLNEELAKEITLRYKDEETAKAEEKSNKKLAKAQQEYLRQLEKTYTIKDKLGNIVPDTEKIGKLIGAGLFESMLEKLTDTENIVDAKNVIEDFYREVFHEQPPEDLPLLKENPLDWFGENLTEYINDYREASLEVKQITTDVNNFFNGYLEGIANKSKTVVDQIKENNLGMSKNSVADIQEFYDDQFGQMDKLEGEHEKSLFKMYLDELEYYKLLRELNDSSKENKFATDDELIAQNVKVVEAHNRAARALTDEKIKEIRQYNWYLIKALGDEVELTESQRNELKEAIKKNNAERIAEKERYANEGLSIAYEYQEAEIDLLESGYEKEALKTNMAYLKQQAAAKQHKDNELKKLEQENLKHIIVGEDYRNRLAEIDDNFRIQNEAAELKYQKALFDIHKKYADKITDWELNKYSQLDEKIQGILRKYDKAQVDLDVKLRDDTDYTEGMHKSDTNALQLAKERELQEGLAAIRKEYNIKGLDDLRYRKDEETRILNENFNAFKKDIQYRKDVNTREYIDGVKSYGAFIKTQSDLQKELTRIIEHELRLRAALERKYEMEVINLKKSYGLNVNQELYENEIWELENMLDAKLIKQEEFWIAVQKLKQKYNVPGAVWRKSADSTEANVPSDEGAQAMEYSRDRSFEIAQQTNDKLFEMRAEADAAEFDRKREALEAQYQMENDILLHKLDKGQITEEQFAAKKAELDKKKAAEAKKLQHDQFEKQRKADILQIVISGLIGAAKAIATYGPSPLGIAMMAFSLIQAGVLSALVAAKKNPYEAGGLIKPGRKEKGAKGLIVGGKPHSSGGTTFVGDDGSSFEAEKDELLAIVNKRDTKTLLALNRLNSEHGKPYFKSGGAMGLESISAPRDMSADDSMKIYQAIKSFTENVKVVVNVDDISTSQDRLNRIRDGAKW